jgi:hypothetical protein
MTAINFVHRKRRQPLAAVQQPLHRRRLELPREAPSGSPLCHPSLPGCLGSLANPPAPGGKSTDHGDRFCQRAAGGLPAQREGRGIAFPAPWAMGRHAAAGDVRGGGAGLCGAGEGLRRKTLAEARRPFWRRWDRLAVPTTTGSLASAGRALLVKSAAGGDTHPARPVALLFDDGCASSSTAWRVIFCRPGPRWG